MAKPNQRTRFSKECDSKRIRFVSLYRPKLSSTTATTTTTKDVKKQRSIPKAFHFVFLVFYLLQGYRCIRTIGQPYEKFLLRAERDGFQVMEGTAKLRAELEYALADVNNPDRPKDKLGWFSWMNMDIEEHANLKKKLSEQSVLDSLPKHMRVPNKYAPEFFASLLFGFIAVLHILIMLLQHWSVAFNVWINFTEIDVDTVDIPTDMMNIPDETEFETSVTGGTTKAGNGDVQKNFGQFIYDRAMHVSLPAQLPTHARITPSPTGRDILVPLMYLPSLGITFEFHRRRYTYNAESQTWTKIRCRTTMPTLFFSTWSGFTSTHQITASQIRFGSNIFQVRQATFMEMYKAQLLSPFTVFQLFCVGLWLLDEYWRYSFLSLFMILMFEATVVFSRLKSLSAIQGMGNKPRPMYVYRLGKWRQIDSTELLPGDILSLTMHKPHYKRPTIAGTVTGQLNPIISDTHEHEDGDVVPADVLLLRGSAVVNEASLTGESVPQMKDGMSELSGEESLSMKNQHKTHVLYAGTKILQCKGVAMVEAEEASSDEDEEREIKKENTDGISEDKIYHIPMPPDSGCLSFVLRTSFSSAQGKLVRMIEGSQEKVKGHEKETGLLLLLLCIFAILSSSYVLYHGLQNEKRSQYELMLHCVLIITSVIPPELPMQMALAVNNSILTLMKLQIFCTEPYRVPIAGSLSATLFDKTGTLTTDELVAVGVLEANNLDAGSDSSIMNLTPVIRARSEAALVILGCHAVVSIENELIGDPLEIAALNAIRWGIAPSGHSNPLPASEKKEAGSSITVLGKGITQLEVAHRHHFSSKLQRMSCVVKDVTNKRLFAVVKGSPEAIGNLLAQKPRMYDLKAKMLAKRGYRVIAMGYKVLSTHDLDQARDSRSYCEESIAFAGFIAFTCRVRKDTKDVLASLMDGGLSVAMVTGDALLTAAHVAKEVGICSGESSSKKTSEEELVVDEPNDELRDLIIKRRKELSLKPKTEDKPIQKVPVKSLLCLEQDPEGNLYWQRYDDESYFSPYSAALVPKLAKEFDLALTGKNLSNAFEFDDTTKKILSHIKIFARMTPDAKETVIECLHSVGILCLMCGDGANDVGALKQADVGVALLSGFGDVNVDKGDEGRKKVKKTDPAADIPLHSIIPKEPWDTFCKMPIYIIKQRLHHLGVDLKKYPELTEKNDLLTLFQVKARQHAASIKKQKELEDNKKLTKAEEKSKKRKSIEEKTEKLVRRTAEYEAKGIPFPQFKAMKDVMAEEIAEGRKRQIESAKANAHLYSQEGEASALVAQFQDLELDEIPMVKLGDASIAAPFTSKIPSIKSCVDIVRQGRCTLVSSLQMYQILALNCLISSYSLSLLYLDGVKYGDTQMTAMSMLESISMISVARSKPLEKLTSVRPLTSIFHPSMFLSLLGQFSIHFVTMILAVQKSKAHLPPGYEPEVDGKFKPGILNSVVFLVSNVQQVTVYVVNLQGRPFMTGFTENRPLMMSLIATFMLTFMFASESIPGLNKYFQLVPFPDEEFRNFIIKLLLADVGLTFFFDRLMKFIFCRHILRASIEGTTVWDFLKLARQVAYVALLMYVFIGDSEQWNEIATDIQNATNTTMIGEL